tara:strand:+ start:9789 stop:10970 length:1182 start_codon:yes stop_codon:yes gene_type:complete
MRIIFFNENWVYGGSNKYIEDLITIAFNEGHEIEYLINYEGFYKIPSGVKNIKISKINTLNIVNKVNILFQNHKYLSSLFKILILIKPIFFLINVLRFIKIIKHKNADLIISCNGGYPGSESCSAIIIASKILKKPNILSIASMPQRRKLIIYPYELLIDKLVERSADIIITYAYAQIKSLKEDRNISASKSKVINNALKKSKTSIDRSYKKERNFTKLGVISRIDKDKSISTLIYVVKNLKKEGYNVKLEIIGDGPELNSIKSLSNNLGLNDKDVSFKGYIEGELDKFLLDFDIYVFPSLLEGLPFSILEAMKFSLPIITTSAGGITEAIEHNKNGIIVDMNSPESFVREIKNLIGNEKLSNNLSSNAFETFNKKFSHEIMYSNFKNLLDEI